MALAIRLMNESFRAPTADPCAEIVNVLHIHDRTRRGSFSSTIRPIIRCLAVELDHFDLTCSSLSGNERLGPDIRLSGQKSNSSKRNGKVTNMGLLIKLKVKRPHTKP